MTRRRGPRRAECHVRIYRHELESVAYRSLSCEGRALLVEFRALFSGQENRIFMSAREAQRRLGVGRHLAEKALAELLDRGFIKLTQKGSFHRKVSHASEYALTNEPLTDRPGDVPTKDYMRWQPPGKKITVLPISNIGAAQQHRGPSELPLKPLHGVDQQHRQPHFGHSLGAAEPHTDIVATSTPKSFSACTDVLSRVLGHLPDWEQRVQRHVLASLVNDDIEVAA